MKLTIHETADFHERYRYDFQMKEFQQYQMEQQQYMQATQQLQLMQMQQQDSAEQAFQDLKDGKGYIANSGDRSSTNEVVIRKVYLGYYDAGQYQPFYQPVVVFEGDGNFWAYVPAVNDDNYGAEVEQ